MVKIDYSNLIYKRKSGGESNFGNVTNPIGLFNKTKNSKITLKRQKISDNY